MSDKQVREAALAVIRTVGALSHPKTFGLLSGDVARAWLAENPEDDETLVDNDWMNSLKGFQAGLNIGEHQVWSLVKDNGPKEGIIIIEVRRTGRRLSLRMNQGLACTDPTCGDVRRLARALRVELGEGK